jgi:hypothetical protein
LWIQQQTPSFNVVLHNCGIVGEIMDTNGVKSSVAADATAAATAGDHPISSIAAAEQQNCSMSTSQQQQQRQVNSSPNDCFERSNSDMYVSTAGLYDGNMERFPPKNSLYDVDGSSDGVHGVNLLAARGSSSSSVMYGSCRFSPTQPPSSPSDSSLKHETVLQPYRLTSYMTSPYEAANGGSGKQTESVCRETCT